MNMVGFAVIYLVRKLAYEKYESEKLFVNVVAAAEAAAPVSDDEKPTEAVSAEEAEAVPEEEETVEETDAE